LFIAGFGAYQAYGKVQAVLGAAKGGLILYLNPLYVALMPLFLLGEPLQHYYLLVAGLILPGIFLVNLPNKKP
jgi:drug/metabolite transporter (DMT)-like permease